MNTAEISDRFDIGISTAVSVKHPLSMHDSYFVLPEQGIFGEIDGLGSSPAPEKASQMIRDLMPDALSDLPSDDSLTPVEFGYRIMRSLLAVNEHVIDTQGRATVVVNKFWEGPKGDTKLIVVGGGHDRTLRYANDRLSHITLDDGLRKLVLTGELDEHTAFQIQRGFSDASELQDVPGWMRPFEPDYKEKVRHALGDPTNELASHIPVRVVDFPRGAVLLTMSDGIPKSLRSRHLVSALRDPLNTNQMAAEQIVGQGMRAPDSINKQADDKTLLIVSFRKN